MLFNSVEYLIFLPVVVAGFFALPARFRWAWLLAASWYFYGSWSGRYLALFVANTCVAYLAGLVLGRVERPRVRLGVACGAAGILFGTLFVFKYLDFVGASLSALLELTGLRLKYTPVRLTLPVGISFYTFQAVAYVIDVYTRRFAPERHPGIFALYKAFFAQLVAGPIERPHRLLPQLHRPTSLDYGRMASGASLILWGMFKKVVIADRLAIYVDQVYDHPSRYHGLPIVLATYLFACQIYCDFSGYSDIALGSARLFGYELMQNFDRPYSARSPREFWARWHISLSTWFRDYLYIPLGGKRVAPWRRQLNLLIVFVVSGLWHGADWTFVAWGALHGTYLLASLWTTKPRAWLVRTLRLERVPRLHASVDRFVVLNLVTFAWLFFRAKSFEAARELLKNATELRLSADQILVDGVSGYELGLAFAAMGLLYFMHQRQDQPDMANFLAARSAPVRWALQYVLLLSIVLFGEFNLTKFIYFQF
jgi:D-alanyl-lipoteichoic acid acyltransferase DltB (MBOAT superfamily)